MAKVILILIKNNQTQFSLMEFQYDDKNQKHINLTLNISIIY